AIGPATQYFGYTFSSSRIFTQLVFQEGMPFSDGGWFANGSGKVQVRQNGTWIDAVLTSSPAYPNGNTQATFGSSFQTYTFTLASVVGDGIRIYGTAGGSLHYVSIGELEAWAMLGAGPLAADPLGASVTASVSATQPTPSPSLTPVSASNLIVIAGSTTPIPRGAASSAWFESIPDLAAEGTLAKKRLTLWGRRTSGGSAPKPTDSFWRQSLNHPTHDG
ncbi:MAG: hypothetical protein WCI73_15215, partial [Phycisphaerae bacterium]